MNVFKVFLLALGVMAAWPGAVARADTALILANARYESAPAMRSLRQIARLERTLTEAGFDTLLVRNSTGVELRQALSRLIATNETERVLIVAAGHFVRSGEDSWLLGTGARRPDLAQVGRFGVPVSVLTEIAAAAPGRAIVALATDGVDIRTGALLEQGIGRVEPPQGVTVVAGAPDAVAGFISGPLLTPGTNIPDVLGAMPDLQAVGFLSSSVAFIPQASVPPPVAVSEDERRLWETVEEIGSRAAYEAYLERYPNGAFVDEANAQIAASRPLTAEQQAQAAEDALNLTRDDRRQLQRYLTMLSYDTGGVDGIFGPATRLAIGSWQAARGYGFTAYLTEEQVVALRNEGAIREAVLAEEQRQTEREDRNWWRRTGSGTSRDGIEAYLERYPEGIFADQARQALAGADAEAAWAQATSEDSIRGYRQFIESYPNSPRVDAARTRIRALRNAGGGVDQDAAAATETALNLPPITRLLVEQRLDRLGLEPGRVDGGFDRSTRRAIRAFQDAQGMTPTGYLDQAVLAALLAGGINDLFR